jgi:hypothetical protein
MTIYMLEDAVTGLFYNQDALRPSDRWVTHQKSTIYRQQRIGTFLYHDHPHLHSGGSQMNEATDVLMAVIGEYDAFWDGTLLPEILDAEEHDCDLDNYTVNLPTPLFVMIDPQIREVYDHMDAINALMATVAALSETCPNGFISENLDGMFFDHPVSMNDGVPDIDLDGQPLD